MRLELWVLSGAIEHDLNIELLRKIADKYTKLGIVPISYNQAELYMSGKDL